MTGKHLGDLDRSRHDVEVNHIPFRKGSVLGPTEIAVDEMKVKMMTKFRDLKDKMDQHKENVPNIFKKK